MLAVLPQGEKVHYLFLTIFKQKLPVTWQEQLAQNTTTDLPELASAADLIWGARSRHAVVAAAPAAPRKPSQNRARSPRDRRQGNNNRRGCGSSERRQEQPAVCGGQQHLLLPPHLRGTGPQLQAALQLLGKLGHRQGGCPPPLAAKVSRTPPSPLHPR
jgi:hypothetical protein